MKDYYATFGYGQTHPLTGARLDDHYTRVPASSYDEAQELMTRSVFGQRWGFLYEHADGPAPSSAGVEQFGLREVPFVAPSPLSDVVWAAFGRCSNETRADRWVEYVSQPIEIAWHQYRVAEAHERLEQARARLARLRDQTHDYTRNLTAQTPQHTAEAASTVDDRLLTRQVAVDDPSTTATFKERPGCRCSHGYEMHTEQNGCEVRGCPCEAAR